jgi:hypothetical protein
MHQQLSSWPGAAELFLHQEQVAAGTYADPEEAIYYTCIENRSESGTNYSWVVSLLPYMGGTESLRSL